MLGIKLPSGLIKWDYETTRRFLMLETAGFKLLIAKIRGNYGFTHGLDRDDLELKFFDQDLQKLLDEIAETLRVNRLYLENAVSGAKNFSKLTDSNLPFYIGPVHMDGFFIRIDPYTRLETVKKSMELCKDFYRDLHRRYGHKYNFSIRERKQPKLSDNCSVFIAIEQKIFDMYLEKNEGKKDLSFKNIDAIKSIINETIRFIDEEDGVTNAKSVYRRMLKRYNIPSFSDFGQIRASL